MKMCDLRITLVQYAIRWFEREANLQHLSQLLKTVPEADLYVLPEMFATGFVMKDATPNDADGQVVVSWMKIMAQSLGAALVGSVSLQEKGARYNRMLLVEPDGRVQQYDKRHLFVKSPEPDLYQQGACRTVFEYKGWRICPQICYDLRFPTWCRNEVCDGQFRYDVLLYVANWPAVRAEAWNTLLKARAIENQAYVVAVNCVGADPAGNRYSGDSQVLDANGIPLAQCREGEEQCVEVALSHKSLSAFRERFPVWQDWDRSASER